MEKFVEWTHYKKGTLSDAQKNLLWEKRLDAAENISHIVDGSKAFSTANEFIDVLERNARS
nr:hypothetical protein [Treponema sp.]